ncbi:hypothetical protein C7974DRAFT_416403 [Boeremia exigua]|uniref:uncharacterized protein n=1 Tax=Boeremia exigua TaxID=749465 RepID=UPI001E8DF6C4|nr:uncharacterized protein C7974DRAFT_416403 [Boeremia exigua]KAH6616248.1 hypothetical protein C7974DRAFT_416403 [Boeremia exigua]
MRLWQANHLSLAALLLGTTGVKAAQKTEHLTASAQSLLDWSNHVNDLRFDNSYKYIAYSDNGPWSVRFTAWYTAGILYRNQGDDVANAKAAVENILSCQYTEGYGTAWYGTFKLSPDEPDPTPDSDLYPPKIYDTYDPNWREFIGSQLIQLVEEFSDLLGPNLVSRIEDSLEIAAVGSMRRNGSFPEGDNLTPAYTNPAIMRAWFVGWIGARRNNTSFIDYANDQGDAIMQLFQAMDSDVFSEYNAPTYYGMDVWALAGAIKYGVKNATMTQHAPYMLTALWKDIADHYNPNLVNMVGPYDRAYSRDMTTNSAVLSYFFWSLYGYGVGPHTNKLETDSLYDIVQGAALALVTDVVASHISNVTAAHLKSSGPWEGSRLLTKKVPERIGADTAYRVVTSWISSSLMIGTQQVNETVNRGIQYVPALVQWAGDPARKPNPYMTFFSLYPSASTIDSVAGPNSLDISYPNTTQGGTKIFTFAVAQLPPSWTLNKRRTISGLERLPCLNVTVEAAGLVKQPVVYGTTLERNRIYNISYVVPESFTGIPKMSLEFEYTC